jgi:putative hemolysin
VDGLAFYLVALVALLCLSAFFSGSEAALFSLSRSQIRTLGALSHSGREIERLLREPRKLLISILLGNLVVNIFVTSAATALMMSLFGERGLGYTFALMSVLIMLFGEIIPKAVAIHWSQRVASRAIVPLRIFHTIVLPIRVPLSLVSDAVIDAVHKRVGQSKRSFTWEELITVLRIARSEGELGRYEYELLSNVLEFRQKIVKEIMTPNIHVVTASVQSGRAQLMRLFADSGLSRIPIHGETTDDVVGLLHIKDMVDTGAGAKESDLRSRLRPAFFVQETTPIARLYNEMQRQQAHVAVVLDEYGSFAGVVTTEDILEELVGEIRDVRDPRAAHFMRIDDDRIVVAGTMEVDEFNEVFGANVVDEDHETVAGYVIGRTGRIPREGETIELDDLRFHVVSAQPHRIRKMRVVRAPREDER